MRTQREPNTVCFCPNRARSQDPALGARSDCPWVGAGRRPPACSVHLGGHGSWASATPEPSPGRGPLFPKMHLDVCAFARVLPPGVNLCPVQVLTFPVRVGVNAVFSLPPSTPVTPLLPGSPRTGAWIVAFGGLWDLSGYVPTPSACNSWRWGGDDLFAPAFLSQHNVLKVVGDKQMFELFERSNAERSDVSGFHCLHLNHDCLFESEGKMCTKCFTDSFAQCILQY